MPNSAGGFTKTGAGFIYFLKARYTLDQSSEDVNALSDYESDKTL
jgi:hypothetical protein